MSGFKILTCTATWLEILVFLGAFALKAPVVFAMSILPSVYISAAPLLADSREI